MAINPFDPFLFNPSAQNLPIQTPPSETETKTDQLKSLIPVNPADILLEKDRFAIPQTEYELFKDLNPDTNELEEGIFLKSPYQAVPTMKWEGLEELKYEHKQERPQRKEISRGEKHAIFNQYIGYFPKECAAEDSYRIKGSHLCMGVFDHEGKLISGSWEYKQEGLSFNLVGDFTYETTVTEQKIVCKGIYTFKNNHFNGTFVVTRKLNEAFFYCTKETDKTEEEAEESRTIEGFIYKGVFKENRLISGSITYPHGYIIKGLWSFETNAREATVIYCHGISSTCKQGSFMHQSKSALHSNLQSDLETTLEWGKWTQLEGPINNLRERVYEGNFFHLKPNNSIPTFLTIYRPEKTSYRWTLKGKYYMTQEDFRQNRQRPI